MILLANLFGLVAARNASGPESLDLSLLRLLSGLPGTPKASSSGLESPASPGTDVQVTSDPANMPQNEPSITINPSNSSVIAAGANDYRLAAQGLDAWAGVYISKDAGETWTNGLLPGYPGGPSSVLTGFDTAGDPALAFDKQGNLYYAGIAFNRAGGGGVRDGTVFAAKSTNTGNTFTTVIVARGSANTFNDKPYIAVDTTNGQFSGRVYISYTQFRSTTGKIQVSFSSNGGASFSTEMIVSDSDVNQGSIPAVGPNGEVYVVWRDLVNNRIKIAKSNNGGTSFSTPVVVANTVPIPNPLPNTLFRTNSFPALAVDPQSGNVYVAWSDYGNLNADILFSRSTNGGQTFSGRVKINDDTTTSDQFFPWLASLNGTVSAVFYDRRLDPSNVNLDVFYTDSTDGGVTFSENVRITDLSIDPNVQFQGQFIGDYIGLALTDTNAHPAWTDTRNLNQDIFTDHVVTLEIHDIAVT